MCFTLCSKQKHLAPQRTGTWLQSPLTSVQNGTLHSLKWSSRCILDRGFVSSDSLSFRHDAILCTFNLITAFALLRSNPKKCHLKASYQRAIFSVSPYFTFQTLRINSSAPQAKPQSVVWSSRSYLWNGSYILTFQKLFVCSKVY